MITCDSCGKVNGEGDIGEHWICNTCKVPEPEPSKDKKSRGTEADKGINK